LYLWRFANVGGGLWRKLLTRAYFLIGHRRKQGDLTSRPTPYAQLQTTIGDNNFEDEVVKFLSEMILKKWKLLRILARARAAPAASSNEVGGWLLEAFNKILWILAALGSDSKSLPGA
jgi:hypothetical protein